MRLSAAASCALVCAVAVAALTGACATTTKVTTEKPGAVVVRERDKKELGTTPVDVSTSMWIWESEKVVVKQGAATKTVELKRTEVDLLPMGAGVCVSLTGCGLVVGVPLILAGGLKLPAETKVKLDDAKAARKEKRRDVAVAY